MVRLVLIQVCVIPVTRIHSITVWSELEAVHCGLAVLSSLGMIWPACVLLVPLAVCWLWISHTVGCKQVSWPAVSAAESGKQQLVKWEDKENWEGVKEALHDTVLSVSHKQ